jgi:predicted ribosome quality control (RQC) complex YloA/Tae2 family protein
MLVEIKDKKLEGILSERAVYHKEVGEIMEKMMALDKEKTKLAYKLDKLKEKTKVIMDKLNPKLEEFEFISRVFMEKGVAYYEVLDQIEEYKKAIREDRVNKLK